ncbi:MAG: GGDEF domain-containing protein [bacterium]
MVRYLRAIGYFVLPGLVPTALLSFLLAGPMELLSIIPEGTLETWLAVLPFLAAVFFLLGICLSVYFNSTRLALMGIFLLLVYGYVFLPTLIGGFRGGTVINPNSFYNSHLLLPILIPLNFIALHFTEDSGFLTQRGVLKAIILVVEIFGLAVVFPYVSRFVFAALDHVPQIRVLNGQLNVPFLTLGLSILALIIFLLGGERNYYSNYISLLFWIILTASLSFSAGIGWNYSGMPYHYALFFGAAGILYNVKIINLAWSKAYRDQLTQIPGRIALDEYLQRLTGQYAICMIDIDHFKDFNDTYGHDAGDKVLKQVADTIKTRTSGRAFRFGGEEFTLVYPGKTVDDVKEELEALRETIENNKVKVTRKSKRATKVLERKVTISLGLAEKNENYDNATEVLNAADNALFDAKDEGRNKLLTK